MDYVYGRDAFEDGKAQRLYSAAIGRYLENRAGRPDTERADRTGRTSGEAGSAARPPIYIRTYYRAQRKRGDKKR